MPHLEGFPNWINSDSVVDCAPPHTPVFKCHPYVLAWGVQKGMQRIEIICGSALIGPKSGSHHLFDYCKIWFLQKVRWNVIPPKMQLSIRLSSLPPLATHAILYVANRSRELIAYE